MQLLMKVIAMGENSSPIPLNNSVPTAQEEAEPRAARMPRRCGVKAGRNW
jgi:hypothetical protein